MDLDCHRIASTVENWPVFFCYAGSLERTLRRTSNIGMIVFVISAASAKRAIKHLAAFGDTDIFPRLPEIEFLKDKAEDVAEAVSKHQPGDFNSSSALELLVPKGTRSFRIAHQLDAFDSLFYLASVIEVAPDLEANRVSADDETAFSYRFVEGEGPRLFAVGGTFHDWIMKLCEFGGEASQDDARVVIETDISDFYQRIYHHRVENALNSASNKKAASIAKKVFKNIRANQSFGLPVGQAASRILAESAMHDTDMFLIEEGVAHTRYVDDFRIIVEDQKVAHGTLCKLAQQLMLTEGLSLNGVKTSIYPLAQLHKEAKQRIDDVFNNPDMKKFENYLKLTYEDDPTEDDGEDDTADLIFFDADDLVDKIIELEEYGGKEISVFKALLKAVKLSGRVSVEKLIELPEDFLYVIPRDYCRAFYNLNEMDSEGAEKLRQKFLGLFDEIPFRDLPVCRYWLLDLFVRGIVPSTWDDFKNYDFTRSIPERRAELLLRGRFNQAHWFRARKTQFASLSSWEKTAFAIGATCLPQDEYEKWVTSSKSSFPQPFQNALADWLKNSWGNLEEILNPK